MLGLHALFLNLEESVGTQVLRISREELYEKVGFVEPCSPPVVSSNSTFSGFACFAAVVVTSKDGTVPGPGQTIGGRGERLLAMVLSA